MSKLKTFDYHTVPNFTFSLKDMILPVQISHVFKKHGVTGGYIYSIKCKGIVIKFGMSLDNATNYGDRVYSQIGQLASWGSHLYRGSGAEFIHTASDFKQMYNTELDHRDMEVTVWNFTNYKYTLLDHRVELRQFEAELIRRYKDLTGKMPLGNLRSEESVLSKMSVSADGWANFEEC